MYQIVVKTQVTVAAKSLLQDMILPEGFNFLKILSAR